MSKIIDMTGKTFGRLTVIDRTINSNAGKGMWNCRCICGKIKSVNGSHLRGGKIISCGCYNLDRISKPPGTAAMNEIFGSYKSNAKEHGRKFDLNIDQFIEITKQNCHYCGTVPSTIYKPRSNNGYYIYNGIDRVDNMQGYTIENVVPCCRWCNIAKGNRKPEEFRRWIDNIVKHQLQLESRVPCVLKPIETSTPVLEKEVYLALKDPVIIKR